MKEQVEFLLGALRSAWRFKWAGLIAAWAVALAGALVVLVMPSKYETRAQIYVDTRSVLRPLLQGLAVSPQTQDQTDVVRRALLARPSVDAVARKTGLYKRTSTPEGRERLLTELADRISIHGDASSGFYTISYTDGSPVMAQSVVQTLLDTFVVTSVGAGEADTQHAESFFADQVADYEKRLSESEQRLADFKKKNVGQMPDQRGDYFARLQAELAANQKLRTDLTLAQRQRDELRSKITGTDSTASTTPTALPSAQDIQSATALDARIRENRKQLDELLLRYTDRHPEVIAAKDTIARLEEQRRVELGGVRITNGARSESSSTAVDPVIQNLQIALNTVDVQYASLQSEVSQSDARVAELRRLVTTGPEVEAELVRLNRDYGVTKAQYEALLQRFETARLSNDANRSEKLRFKILEPPRAALRPVSPNRPLFLVGVLLAALGTGIVVAIIVSQTQPVFLSRKALVAATGIPVIGVVRHARSPVQLSTQRRETLAYSFCLLLLFGVFAVVLALNYPTSRILRHVMGWEDA